MFITKSFDQFANLFVSRLIQMLSEDELGAFILVLANSRQNEFLKSELTDKLNRTFAGLYKNFSSVSQSSAQDDIDVFNSLCEHYVQAKGLDENALDAISIWRSKNIGHWDVCHNTMRKLRPARASSQMLNSIIQPFDDSKFHFNKPFLKPEILWQGVYNGTQLRVMYNKFPFADYHLIIAISPEQNLAQRLTEDTHQLIYSLTRDVSAAFPGFGIGFNSLAAGASVNHLHFQGFVREQAFPVESDYWQHNGGDIRYPLNAYRFNDKETAWEYIDELIRRDIAFNCLYRNDSCFVFPRKYQGTVELPEWLNGAGWLDVAGVITVSDEKTFDLLDEHSVSQALGTLAE